MQRNTKVHNNNNNNNNNNNKPVQKSKSEIKNEKKGVINLVRINEEHFHN